jgi:2-polyprenyl-3-methyl-5-hydroxy-6-metoxy-1,4-benzoquinol methylase
MATATPQQATSAHAFAPPDPTKLDALVGRLFGDIGACASGALVMLGDHLGIYKAMARLGPATPAEIADAVGAKERYIREWLSAQAAADYVEFDKWTGKFSVSPEQATVFANEDSPAFMSGAFEVIASMWRDEPKIGAAFKSGKGVGWHEHDACLFCGTERFFRPGYNAHLVNEWIPALDGVEARLKAGAKVADVGCGHGASTVLMAKAYPNSRFTGFDYHAGSIDRAKLVAAEAGVADRVDFQVAAAASYPGKDYDLVCIFDALHDMGDPVGAAKHIRETLKPDGVWMLVEPFANDDLADNLNPVGRVYYSASTMICTPNAQSQGGRYTLGAQVPDATWAAIMADGGLTRFRRVTQTPFNRVFEIRP